MECICSLGGIDQTLKVLKYAVELKGAAAALPDLHHKGLLPSGLVSWSASPIATAASSPAIRRRARWTSRASTTTGSTVPTAIALAVISLGHKLNLRVIAEGVETEPQRRFPRENDCDEMQGYLFNRPLPPDQVAALLRAQSLALATAA